MTYDVCIIGGGIVGLATARAILLQRPATRLLLLEKEDRLAAHQTGRNSGVIHSGIYYAPDSLKARLCREGAIATVAFCQARTIPYEICGKLLVATNSAELERMTALHQRSLANGISVEVLDADQLAAAEPHVRGVAALRVASTGIVDYAKICGALAKEIAELGAHVMLRHPVNAIEESGCGVRLRVGSVNIDCSYLVACAGLQSDRLARLAGLDPDIHIVPFKGEYFRLPASRAKLINHLIYPIPDPALPFLGIHITRMIDGSVTVGPNAVLALRREGYAKVAFNLRDAADTLVFPGFWRAIAKHGRAVGAEVTNSLSRRRYLQACQKFCPSLNLDDLQPHPSGIRAQAVQQDGTMVHDFLFAQTDHMLHVLNAPSPAATAALPIGEMIASQLLH